jgi:hypothetical protein
MKDEVFGTLYEVGRNSMVVNSRAQQFHWGVLQNRFRQRTEAGCSVLVR